ncbi:MULTISPECIES: hypothetical protein [Hyphomicrobiales]|uniref:Uncharacterized protein n=1 Tax=Camelimonas fluminis TaxID=1576911 RepID=A0ABV7UHV7_9HYPH|nr:MULTISPECIES: hypothetical protein [Hyphomicrobiales]
MAGALEYALCACPEIPFQRADRLDTKGKNLISIKESSFRAGFIGDLSSPLGKKS